MWWIAQKKWLRFHMFLMLFKSIWRWYRNKSHSFYSSFPFGITRELFRRQRQAPENTMWLYEKERKREKANQPIFNGWIEWSTNLDDSISSQHSPEQSVVVIVQAVACLLCECGFCSQMDSSLVFLFISCLQTLSAWTWRILSVTSSYSVTIFWFVTSS